MPAERYVGVSSAYRRVIDRYVGVGGAWRQVRERYVGVGGAWRLSYQRFFALTVSATTTTYNIRSSALAAGWNGTDPIDVLVTVNPAVFLRATLTSNYGLDTGTPWPAGSSLTLILTGLVQGKGGAGGAGGSAGLSGGAAINLQYPISIDNGAGFILGGGGGGGGGSSAHRSCGGGKSFSECTASGGGAGGGAGTGAGGAIGGAAGTNVLTTGANGAGGAGGALSCCGGGNAGNGGPGGDWGAPGSSGATGFGGGAGFGAGGAAGKAINLNGNALTWLAGNDPTRVKGAVS